MFRHKLGKMLTLLIMMMAWRDTLYLQCFCLIGCLKYILEDYSLHICRGCFCLRNPSTFLKSPVIYSLTFRFQACLHSLYWNKFLCLNHVVRKMQKNPEKNIRCIQKILVCHTVNQLFRLDLASLFTYQIIPNNLGQTDVDVWWCCRM